METSVKPRPSESDVPHFAWVEPWLLRGAQPTKEGYRWLARNGVTIVVNLRTSDKDARELSAVRGLREVHVPVENDRAPTIEQAREFLQLCASRKLYDRIFVHCRGGEGRTSTFCALVLVAQGMPVEQVIEHERLLGFKPETHHRDQAIFLRDFAKRAAAGEIQIPRLQS